MKGTKRNAEGLFGKTPDERELVMYDSQNHTFGDAIDAIWIATGHDEIQCEQLAMLIDATGCATIKVGNIDELQPMAETIELEGFKVAIF
jgi:hypothetical protein